MLQLSEPQEREKLEHRLSALRQDSVRKWGAMSAHGMVCHLADSFRFALGMRSGTDVSTFVTRTLFRWIALHTPLPWPKGVPTLPETDQAKGGTPPRTFGEDREELIGLMWNFAKRNGTRPPHPIFGRMSEDEWQHWAWRHVNHHLRQFGV